MAEKGTDYEIESRDFLGLFRRVLELRYVFLSCDATWDDGYDVGFAVVEPWFLSFVYLLKEGLNVPRMANVAIFVLLAGSHRPGDVMHLLVPLGRIREEDLGPAKGATGQGVLPPYFDAERRACGLCCEDGHNRIHGNGEERLGSGAFQSMFSPSFCRQCREESCGIGATFGLDDVV